MGVLSNLKKATIQTQTQKSKIGIAGESSLEVVTRLLTTVVSSQNFSSQEEIVLLMKQLLDQSILVKSMMDQSVSDKQNYLRATDLVCNLYKETGLTDLNEIKKYFAAYRTIEPENFADIVPDVSSKLEEITSYEFKDESPASISVNAAILESLCKLIPVFTASLGEYVNVRNQVVNSLETINAGLSYVINNTGGYEMGPEWVAICVESTVNLYLNSLKIITEQYSSKGGAFDLALLADVKKNFASNIGNVLLALKYISPLITEHNR